MVLKTKTWLLGVTLVASLVISREETTEARRDVDCSGAHGAWTDRLCNGDGFHTDQYIISPNGHYRLYFVSNGTLHMFRTVTDEWISLFNFSIGNSDAGYSDASHAMFADSHSPSSAGFNFGFYQWCGDGECYHDSKIFAEFTEGDVVLVITDAGCLERYDQGGNRYHGAHCDSQ
jgi:hypothetical protein